MANGRVSSGLVVPSLPGKASRMFVESRGLRRVVDPFWKRRLFCFVCLI